MENRVLYTRSEHGMLPVCIHREGQRRIFEVRGEKFNSFRGLMTELNGGTDPKVGFDRYFRLGVYADHPSPVVSPFVMFRADSQQRYIHVTRRGIDLSRKWRDIERLFYAGFRTWLESAGYTREDFEEVLQDIHVGFLARNRGKGAWDASRSSFGHYVHMVCRSVVTNHYNRRKRRLSRESLGVVTMKDGERRERDAAEAERLLKTKAAFQGVNTPFPLEDLRAWIISRYNGERRDVQTALSILPYVFLGMRRGEIAAVTGEDTVNVGRALAFIREASRAWQEA